MASRANLAEVTHLRPVPDPKPPPKLADRVEAQPRVAELERWATVLRIDCVRMLAVAKSGHLDSSLSAADIVAALYYRVLRHEPDHPEWPSRDRFVLCKGHAAPIQYAALAQHGYFPLEDLTGLRRIGEHLQGHPDMRRTPGIEVSTGSLGQGLSMCVGICLALRLDGLDVVAPAERVGDEVLEPPGDRRRVRVDDQEHPRLGPGELRARLAGGKAGGRRLGDDRIGHASKVLSPEGAERYSRERAYPGP